MEMPPTTQYKIKSKLINKFFNEPVEALDLRLTKENCPFIKYIFIYLFVSVTNTNQIITGVSLIYLSISCVFICPTPFCFTPYLLFHIISLWTKYMSQFLLNSDSYPNPGWADILLRGLVRQHASWGQAGRSFHRQWHAMVFQTVLTLAFLGAIPKYIRAIHKYLLVWREEN